MAEAYQKIADSTLLRTFANDPPPNAIIAPPDGLFASGWADKDTPPAQWINALYKDFGEKINHSLQHGIAKWDAVKTYNAGDCVTHTGTPWLSVATSTGSAPSSGNLNWVTLATGRGISGSMYAAHGGDVALTTTAAAIPVNSNIQDGAGSIDHDTVTNNSRFTVNKDGMYEYNFQANILTTSGSPDGCYLWIAKNGTELPNSAYAHESKNQDATHQVNVSGTILLDDGDYIELFAVADTNGHYSLDFTASSGSRPAVPSVVVNMKGW
jgi:hypothetical protein